METAFAVKDEVIQDMNFIFRNELVTNCDRFNTLKHNQQYLPIFSECFAYAHDRFPKDLMFQLTDSEVDLVVSQNATPSRKLLGGK